MIALCVLAVVGFGCVKDTPTVTAPSYEGWIAYENTDYGFALAYPTNLELRTRPAELQDTEYVGLPVKFFASLRDTTRSEKAENLAYFYAAEGVTLEAFTTALAASDPGNIVVKETSDLSQGGLSMKKIISTTALGADKVHYLFWKDSTLVIISQFLGEDEAFAPVFETLKSL